MDPNTLSNLDPKLKETYDRVMGTSTPPASIPGDTTAATPPPASQQPTADVQPSGPSSESMIPKNDQPITSAGNASTPDQEPHPETVTITQPVEDAAPSNIIAKPHGHMGLIRVFYILGGTVFFVIYIFFWAKIFNIKLPF